MRRQLVDLPVEILAQIIEYLDDNKNKSDIINCSAACKKLRIAAIHVIFRQVFVTWNNIDELVRRTAPPSKDKNHKGGDLVYIAKSIQHLEFREASLSGEWHKGEQLRRLIEQCPRCTSLSFISAGSAVWAKHLPELKTIRNIKIRSMLAIDKACGKTFRLTAEDLRSFPRAESIHIEGFEIEGSEDRKLHAKVITLRNCRWNFPTNIEDVMADDVKQIRFILTGEFRQYHYDYKFREFLTNPPTFIETLYLEVSPDMHMELPPVSAGLKRRWKNMRKLTIKGFRFPSSQCFDSLPQELKEFDIYIDDSCDLKNDLSKIEKELERQRLLRPQRLHIQLIYRS